MPSANGRTPSREEIKKAAAGRLKPVEVEGWPGVVYVRPLSGKLALTVFDAFQLANEQAEGEEEVPVSRVVEFLSGNLGEILASSITDQEGQLVFDPEDPEDTRFLESEPIGAQMPLLSGLMQTSGLTAEAEEEVRGN